jgi:hypothetical protein
MSDYLALLTLRPDADVAAIGAAIATACAPFADGPAIVAAT